MGRRNRITPGRGCNVDGRGLLIAIAVVSLLTIGGTGTAPSSDAAPPPAGRFDHGAAGSALNGTGGQIAPSPTSASWPGTGNGGNGGAFAFIGAQYGSLWNIPATANNSLGVGYCVMEDVGGVGTVARQPDPAAWDAGEMARAGALMATFGGDRVVPYGIDASGPYDVVSGEWQQPSLLGGGEYTRRRQVAVNFGVKMFVEDVSPTGVAAGRTLARDTAVVGGTDGNFSALRNGYVIAQRMAAVADVLHAVGGLQLAVVWRTTDGRAPDAAGTYPVEVHATDSMGKAVGFVPIVQLSDVGIDGNRSIGTTAAVNQSADSPDDAARWSAAHSTGWPTWAMDWRMADDSRFVLPTNPLGADVADAHGVARFDITVPGPEWELAFHAQAPTDDVELYAGTGVQGQITWTGAPQSASVHIVVAPAPTPPPPPATGTFVIRKSLDAADVQGTRDMSGFVFQVSRQPGAEGAGDADGATVDLGTFTTGADGRTLPIDALAGEYRIVEVGRPAWSEQLIDGGPVTFAFDPDVTPGPIDIDYVNREPTVTIDTSARDALDGDRSVMLDPTADGVATIIDTVTYRNLVPGTEYRATGELVDVTPEPEQQASVTLVSDTNVTMGTSGSITFTPTSPDGEIEVPITVPHNAELRGRVVVVFQRLAVASSDREVAAHADPEADAQTIRFPLITTRLGLADATTGEPARPGDRLVDVVTHAGLEPGRRYRAELTLHQRHDDGTCTPTDQYASIEFEPVSASGTIDVIQARLPGVGTYVAFERIFVLDVDGTATPLLVATHEDCDDEAQTIHAVAPPVPDTSPTTPTASTSAPPPAPPSTLPPQPLPRTGGTSQGATIGGALALLLIGAGLLLVVRRVTPGVRPHA